MAKTWKQKAFAATRGTQFGAIFAAAIDQKIPVPRFTGKATITSDNFVMANFVDKNGNGHSGAFVGSASDLVRNTIGLADMLKLKPEDRRELFGAIHGWVSTDYSAGRALKTLVVTQ